MANENVELPMNIARTKTMVMNGTEGEIRLENLRIGVVDHYTYPGQEQVNTPKSKIEEDDVRHSQTSKDEEVFKKTKDVDNVRLSGSEA
ncbi:hypothetical protein ANCDUO_20414 [Ancylostoma duodenale]|uniref:Uncharacterized protein n=1 Tax=Ancylostoma duodenale TaxID=51022 RepID=A0A0C2FX94_9BILA|nr:hypothetical protein ANCDUO_20414 [Ancylostoma duodenale]